MVVIKKKNSPLPSLFFVKKNLLYNILKIKTSYDYSGNIIDNWTSAEDNQTTNDRYTQLYGGAAVVFNWI